MRAATAPWAGPPPKSPKATKPDMGWTRSKGGSPSADREAGVGEVVVEVVGGGDDVVVLASDGTAAPCSRRVGVQAGMKPAARKPSMCRRDRGAGAMKPPYRGPDRARPRQSGKSVTLWRDRATSTRDRPGRNRGGPTPG